MRTITFRTLAETAAWSPAGSRAVRQILLDARAQIERVWQETHAGQPRPYPDWLVFRWNDETPPQPVAEFQTDIFTDPWTRADSERVLAILLEALTRIDQVWLRLNPDSPDPYRAGVRYIREVGTEEWLAIPEILREGGGDCEDGSSWLTSWRRERDGDPAAHDSFYYHDVDGIKLYHIQTTRGDGRVEDWSADHGMNAEIPWGFKPLHGITFEVALETESMLQGALRNDDYYLGQLARLRDYAEAGEPEAQLRFWLAKALRRCGFDGRPRAWVRAANGAWGWAAA